MVESEVASPVRFCPLCNKPFATATATNSYSRHVSYCRRTQNRPRVRRKSCRACKAAKVKCNFETRCLRCIAKNLDCVYEHGIGAADGTTSGARTSSEERGVSNGDMHKSLGLDEQVNLNDFNATLNPDEVTGANDASLDLEFLEIIGQSTTLETSNDMEIIPMHTPAPFTATSLLDGITLLPQSWDPPPKDHPLLEPSSSFLTRVPLTNAVALRSADLIMDALYAIPSQMLRRETFPPFIHPHWHLESLPEPLSVCMHIARMYFSPASEIRPFVWRSILAQQRRAVSRFDFLSSQELLAETQAGVVYMLMRLVDGVSQDVAWNREMTTIQSILCNQFLERNNNRFCESEADNPSLSWEDWIYAESRRRTSLVWFLIARTIVVQSKVDCSTTDAPESLPLPASKIMWEARTKEEWLEEFCAGSAEMEISTFGGLVETKQKSHERENRRVLGAWNARTDGLGSLLNVAVGMVQ